MPYLVLCKNFLEYNIALISCTCLTQGKKKTENAVHDPKLGMLLILLQTPVQLSAVSQVLQD